MDHVAIDLGGRESQICRRASESTIIEERRCKTRALPAYLEGLAPARVIVETCAEAFAVADAALAAGHQVRVVPATLVRALGVGARGIKNDQRDARTLSEVSCRIDLPSVHIPAEASRQVKTECGMREALVSSRTQLINTVRGWLRATVAQLSSGHAESFAERVRSYCLKHNQVLPSYVTLQLETIEHLSVQIAKADKSLLAMAKANPVCQRLMTVPGIGPVNAVRFVATVDSRERFANAHALESYLGLTPGEDSSSDRQRRTSITKAGSARLRANLIQASWSLVRSRPKDPIVQWFRQVEHRRGKRIAIVAVARKIVGILFALWRDGTRYEAQRAALPTETPSDEERMEQALKLLEAHRR